MSKSQRLLSLDVLRGLTVAGMILVNNGYGESFEMLRHSRWNGMTPCDLVFPFFLFIVGIACYLSLSKNNFTPTPQVLRRVVKRTILLFAIGLAINWFDHAIEGDLLCFGHLRIWAVMQRIALCYFFASLFALYANHRYTIPAIIFLLAAYTLLLIIGDGYAEDASTNILAQADLQLFGYDHLYHKSPVDPEGLLGTISGVAHVLIGFYCGQLIKQNETIEQKALAVFAVGTVCVIAGYLLTYGLPLNKRIWSPSYVLVTCGLAALLQALLIKREAKAPLSSPERGEAPLSSPEGDTNAGKPCNKSNEAPSGAVGGGEAPLSSPERGEAPLSSPEGDTNASKPCNKSNEAPSGAVGGACSGAVGGAGALGRAFVVFGVNALALYVASELLAILFGHFGISDAIYNVLHSVIPWDKWASLAYALTFVAINYAIGYGLWKRKIFIKL